MGRISVRFPEGLGPTWFPDQPVQLDQDNHRALYPALDVRYASAADGPKWQVEQITGHFLFKGDQPFQLGLRAGKTHDASVEPVADPERRGALLNRWWRQYKSGKRAVYERYQGPALVHNYLCGMLKRRLGPADSVEGGVPFLGRIIIEVVDALLGPLSRSGGTSARSTPARDPSIVKKAGRGSLVWDFDRFVGLLFGTESIRVALQGERMLEDSQGHEVADRPLPHPIMPRSISLPPRTLHGEIEPIARHVPEECFYLRCRSVADYLWLRDLVMSWGGSIDDLISTQALDHQIRPRLEQQLALPSDAQFCDKLDGAISDMALIGTDLFFRDGPALGVLFEASDGDALAALIGEQRDAVWRRTQAVEREIELGDRKARFLSTPDNAIRSVYAIDGKYHLVTTSSYIARRFFEAGRSQRSLGELKEFYHARATMPLSRDDAAFIYVSDPFFRMLVGPRYRIEMTRRLRALGDLQLVQMAALAADVEGIPGATVPELIRAGLLPPTFLDRPDASRSVLQEGVVFDSLRGGAGSFLPIPDVPLAAATASEVSSYHAFANYYRNQWRRMDPVVVGISRQPGSQPDREKVVLDVRITPYARENYEFLSRRLDVPDQLRRVPVAGDLLAVEGQVKSLASFWRAIPVANARVFGGLRDFAPGYAIKDGRVETVALDARRLLGDEYPIYVGLNTPGPVPSTSSLDRHLDVADDAGYSRSQGALFSLLTWRRVWNEQWAAWSNRKEILEEITPQLHLEEAERPAQVRFSMGDVSEAKLSAALQAVCYMHARRISAANAALVDEISQQLAVPPEDARQTVETLLGAKLVCPLGGKYRFDRDAVPAGRWTGTAWPKGSLYEETEVPDDFRFPFLDWLRGAEMELTLDRWTLSAHVELLVKSPGVDRSNPKRVTSFRRPIASDTPRSDDLERIQGTWEVVSLQCDGKPLAEEIGIQICFQDETIIHRDKEGRTTEFKYRLDPKAAPKRLDTLRRDRQAWRTNGIYQLDADRLTLCYSADGDSRPGALVTAEGDGPRLAVLRRTSPANNTHK